MNILSYYHLIIILRILLLISRTRTPLLRSHSKIQQPFYCCCRLLHILLHTCLVMKTILHHPPYLILNLFLWLVQSHPQSITIIGCHLCLQSSFWLSFIQQLLLPFFLCSSITHFSIYSLMILSLLLTTQPLIVPRISFNRYFATMVYLRWFPMTLCLEFDCLFLNLASTPLILISHR